MKKIALILLSFSFLIIFLSTRTSTDQDSSDQGKTAIKQKVIKSQTEWKKSLLPDQYYILRTKGTEQAFSGKYVDNKKSGIYNCAGCNNPLFTSDTKFKSGTGWPSFYDQATDTSIVENADNSYGMRRVEVVCMKCEGHLGHVFEDGPEPTGLRYCINSASLNFKTTE